MLFHNFKWNSRQGAQRYTSFVCRLCSAAGIKGPFRGGLDNQVAFLSGFYFVCIGLQMECQAFLSRGYILYGNALRRIV